MVVKRIVVEENTQYYSVIFRGLEDVNHKLEESELRMTWTILIIATCYIIFTLPVTIADELGQWQNFKQYITSFIMALFENYLNASVYAIATKYPLFCRTKLTFSLESTSH